MANIQINITENGTTTLATSGCICDRNIDINVDVAGSGGGGYVPTDAELTYTGVCDYIFAWDNNKWIIDNYGDSITTENLDTANYMFKGYNGETVPFELNFTPKNGTYITDAIFQRAEKLKELPIMRNLRFGAFSGNMFAECKNLRRVSMDTFPNADFTYYQSYGYGQQSSIFSGCISLREIDKNILDKFMAIEGRSNPTYIGFFSGCSSLDELKDLYVITSKAITSNMFSSFCGDCSRLKTITFETDNGTPKVAQWKSQIIDLTNVGYMTSSWYPIVGYNSGCTNEDKVTDDTTYQTLKNTDNWWTNNVAYSRFNHDSAVATINSLPDCSAYLATAGGTNTIKFKGASGSATDGGAINTLTEEEIAVATAKGWTVEIV